MCNSCLLLLVLRSPQAVGRRIVSSFGKVVPRGQFLRSARLLHFHQATLFDADDPVIAAVRATGADHR